MEWENLPVDLQVEILSRFPVKFLARLRSTSKRWNALLRSGRFANVHSADSPKESLIIMLMDYKVYLAKVNIRLFHENVKSSFNVASQLYLKDPSNSSQVDIRNIFHCDGLLLCTTKDNRLVVWNPCSGETKWIKPLNSYKESDYYALGYDYKSSCKEYKILRMDPQGRGLRAYIEFEIFDFTTDSWRDFGETDEFVIRSLCGASVNGKAYVVAFKREQPYHEFVISFDFSTESFQRLSFPKSFPCLYAALSVREEKLCLLGYYHENMDAADLHVWLRTSTGSVMSWKKFLRAKTYHYNFFMFPKGMSFLADEQNKAVLVLNERLYIVVKNDPRELEFVSHNDGDSTYRSSCSNLLNYVPSLAQIQHGKLLG